MVGIDQFGSRKIEHLVTGKECGNAGRRGRGCGYAAYSHKRKVMF